MEHPLTIIAQLAIILSAQLPAFPTLRTSERSQRPSFDPGLHLLEPIDKDGWDEEYEGIASGWQMALATLKLYAERYFGQPRAQFFAMQPAEFEYRDLLPCHKVEAALARLAAALDTRSLQPVP